MKRDEALLKKAITDAEKYKKQLQTQKPPQERLIVQPVAMPGVKAARGQAKAGEQRVPDAEEIQNKFMDKLTSQLENYFAADEEGEGALADASVGVEDSEAEQQTAEADAAEGDQVAKKSIEEANRATSLEEKEKLLSAVKQNVD